MSTTVGGIRIVDMPDLGVVTDDSSVVGEHAGSGRFTMPALKSYVGGGGGGALSIKDFGARSDGTTDDSAAVSAGIAAVAAMPTGGKLLIPAGRTILANGINAVIPAGKTITLEGMGSGNTELYFSNPTNGLNFELGNSGTTWGGIHLRGLSIIRGPTFPVIADVGLYIWVDSGAMYAGASSVRDLIIRGSSPLVNSWHDSLVLAGIGGITIDTVSILGINSATTDRGDVLMTLTGGPGSGQYAASYAVSNCYLQGGSAGIAVTEWVQGVYVGNTTVIGQYDSIRWTGGIPFGAEEIAIANCSLNGAHRGVWLSGVNQSGVSNTTVLHFNVGAAADFAGIELNQASFNTIIGNNIIGALAGTETGILLSNCARGPNVVVGNLTGNLNDAGIWLEGDSAFSTVVGNNLTGGTGIVQDATAYGNIIMANQWNGNNVDFSPSVNFSAAIGVTGNIFLNAPPGQINQVIYDSIGSANPRRWFVGVDGTAESGSNAGANYEIAAAADNGSVLGAWIKITRANGWIQLGALPPNATSDGAAATANIPIGGLYRNGSALQIRVA